VGCGGKAAAVGSEPRRPSWRRPHSRAGSVRRPKSHCAWRPRTCRALVPRSPRARTGLSRSPISASTRSATRLRLPRRINGNSVDCAENPRILYPRPILHRNTAECSASRNHSYTWPAWGSWSRETAASHGLPAKRLAAASVPERAHVLVQWSLLLASGRACNPEGVESTSRKRTED
jgi:hypothetical protein